MGRVTTGRAVFYTRDSGGRHETTPGEYVKWAQRKADELKVDFSGTVEDIQQLIQRGESAKGDIFLDFEVPGHGWHKGVR